LRFAAIAPLPCHTCAAAKPSSCWKSSIPEKELTSIVIPSDREESVVEESRFLAQNRRSE
jgi:hypothetical protein